MLRNYLFNITILLTSLFLVNQAARSQSAQWQGPDRNNIYPDTGLLRSWPEEGPRVNFAVAGLGKGLSSAVTKGDIIFTTGTIDSLEYLTAINDKGDILWQTAYGRCWTKSYPEARSTPAVDENRIYVISGLDELVCLDNEVGKIIWKVDLHATYQSSWDMFGVSESPLIFQNMVYASPGGDSTTLVALNKFTGELEWKSASLGMKRSNISPALIGHCGKYYVISATQTHVVSADAYTGEIMWTYHYNFLDANNDNTTILVNTPTYRDSCLWISNGWDVKSLMLEISPDGKSVSERFADQTFDNQNHGLVLLGDYLYGSNFTGRQTGKWVCMNWQTGEIVWLEEWYNKGPLISADGMLYCLDEKQGHLGLVLADPKEFKLISSFKISHGTGPFWSRPSISNGNLLIRHGDFLISYNLRDQ